MAITGSQKAITPARSGLLRSGAGRSGWPVTVGAKALLYAISNIARSGATRSNYHSGQPFLALGGVWSGAGGGAGARVLVDSLTISDLLDHEASTATFRVQGDVAPPIGQDILITLGTPNTLERLFAGQVLATALAHLTSDHRNPAYDVRAIDWTWGLQHRVLARRWLNTSATTIARDLVALGPAGYTSEFVAAGLPLVDEFTVTDLPVPAALSALTKRIGGYWYVDYYKRLHLWTVADPDPGTPPTVINAIHPTFSDLTIDTDGSQLVTRVFVEGGGSAVQTAMPLGETRLPVETAAWYEVGGGVVKAGPQKLRYTGRVLGGGGGLVGPGASPSAAPRALVIGGAGIDPGYHEYGVTFTTVTGESLVSPRVGATVGFSDPPPTAPTVGSLSVGAGPDSGSHFWVVTYLTASGETVNSPLVWATVPAGTLPLTAPVPTTPGFGGAIEPGSFVYVVTFETAGGESTPGPWSSVVTLTLASPAPIPTTPPVAGPLGFGGAMEPAGYRYLMTFETSGGESTPGPLSDAVFMTGSASVAPIPTTPPVAGPPGFSGAMELATYAYVMTFETSGGEGTPGPAAGVSLTTVEPTPPPSTAPTLGTTTGGAIAAETYHYAASYQTADGESTLGTVSASIQTGQPTVSTPPPATSPSVDAQITGDFPAGSYRWGVTYLTASGETMISPFTAYTSIAAAKGVRLNLPIGPSGVVTGRKIYRQLQGQANPLHVGTAGENVSGQFDDRYVAGNEAAAITPPPPTAATTPPLIAPTLAGQIAGNFQPGQYKWGVTYLTAAGETTISPLTSFIQVNETWGVRLNIPTGSAAVTKRKIFRSQSSGSSTMLHCGTVHDNTATTFDDVVYGGNAGATSTPPTTSNTAAAALATAILLAAIPIGPAGVTGRHLYRTIANSGTWRRVTTIGNNTATTYTDLASSASIAGNPAPATGGAPQSSVPLTLPTGPAGVLARALYRSSPGTGGVYRRVVRIGNNATTSYTDTSASAAIVGNPTPPPPTALSSVPLTVPTGPSGQGIVRRHLYRYTNASNLWRRLTTFENNSTTSYTDVTSSAAIVGNPTLPSGTMQTAIPITDIPKGPSGTQQRHLYRAKPGITVFQKLVTLANNATTSYTDTTPTSALGAEPPTLDRSGAHAVTLTKLPIGGPDVTGRRLYRSKAGGELAFLVVTIADNTTTSVVDTVRDAALGVQLPSVSTALANRVALSSIPLGSSAVTARKIYRTPTGGGALKFLIAIADNVTTVYTDAAADATLGAAPPALDGSGLQQPPGQVNPGATTLIVAGAAGFQPLGGWAVIGNGQQVIRYSSITASALTGLPATGPGSITASISYNSTVTASPMLIGIPASGDGAILYPLARGDDVNLWVQVDDVAAQTLVAQLFTSAAAGVHDGIIDAVLQDRRLSATEARARGQAHLQQRRTTELRVRYRCRDLNTRAGRTVTITLLGPPYFLSAQFVIQSVTIGEFMPPHLPVFTVDASSTRFSFEDLLRRLGATPVDT